MTLHLYTKLDNHGNATNAQYNTWLAAVKKRERKSAFYTAMAMAAVTGFMVYFMLHCLPIGAGI